MNPSLKQAKRIALFGSTGSIGKQALEVIDHYKNLLEVSVLVAHSNYKLLIEQAIKFLPDTVVIVDKHHYKDVSIALEKYPIKVFTGKESLNSVAKMDNYDMMLAAIVGFAGIESTLIAAQSGKAIALANKESLVVAGDLITEATRKNGSVIVPVDSEHVAIDQCLDSGSSSEIKQVTLTASGGAFRLKDYNFIKTATHKDALQHPTWTMGNKITIDSATLMNKGLEIIEAKWLFNLTADQINAVIHPQSIIHSMVEYIDGQFMAQLALPDMKIPIAYALFYPKRMYAPWSKFDPLQTSTLSFEPIDEAKFPAFRIAKDCLKKGGVMPCILNAANEIVVEAYLQEKLGFYAMTDIIEKTLMRLPQKENATITDYLEYDSESRKFASSLIP